MLLVGHLNLLDCLLVAVLCLIIPFRQLRDSLRLARSCPPRSLAIRAQANFGMLGVPLVLLALDWWISGRSAAALGLALPIAWRGEIGLAIALLLSGGFMIASLRPTDKTSREVALKRFEDAGLLVKNPSEITIFVPLAFLIGCGGEVLFRGFLFWAFLPFLGTVGTVAVMTLAYGLGHGFGDWRAALGSLVSAFLFAVAFALTQSLWWLMIFHTFTGLNAAWTGYRLSHHAAP